MPNTNDATASVSSWYTRCERTHTHDISEISMTHTNNAEAQQLLGNTPLASKSDNVKPDFLVAAATFRWIDHSACRHIAMLA
jgi:hypothetical protein